MSYYMRAFQLDDFRVVFAVYYKFPQFLIRNNKKTFSWMYALFLSEVVHSELIKLMLFTMALNANYPLKCEIKLMLY